MSKPKVKPVYKVKFNKATQMHEVISETPTDFGGTARNFIRDFKKQKPAQRFRDDMENGVYN